MSNEKLHKLDPQFQLVGSGSMTVSDFWTWAYSDILSNRNRAVFAEFLVGTALGLTDTPRIEWDAYDFVYKGTRIEVKSAAYLQSWQQNGFSPIRFDIEKKQSWFAATNTSSTARIRPADIYVFCLYPETDAVKCNVLDVKAWEFYVVPTSRIEKECGNQKSIGLKRLQKLTISVTYSTLRSTIDSSLGKELCPGDNSL